IPQKPEQKTPVTVTKNRGSTTTTGSVAIRRTTRAKKPSKLAEEATLPPTPISTTKGKKRKRGPVEEPDINELPHNLGKLKPAPSSAVPGDTKVVVNVE